MRFEKTEIQSIFIILSKKHLLFLSPKCSAINCGGLCSSTKYSAINGEALCSSTKCPAINGGGLCSSTKCPAINGEALCSSTKCPAISGGALCLSCRSIYRLIYLNKKRNLKVKKILFHFNL